MEKAKELLTAMTLNVQCWNVTEARLVNLPTMIRKYMPDLLGVQEATTKWMDTLKEALPEYECVGLGREANLHGERSAVFFKKEKFTLLESATKWLSPTPDVPGSKFEDSAYIRICTYAVLCRKSDGKELMHLNTHLDWMNMSQKQIAVMFELVKDKDYPILLTGDFNLYPTTSNYQMILDNGYVDSHTIAKDTNWQSDGKEIDFLFFHAPEVEVLQHRLCTELINGERVSDHHPVYIEFML